MNGKALCMLTKEDFCQRVPGLGDVLYNTLRVLVNQPPEGIGYPTPSSPSVGRPPPLIAPPSVATSGGHIITSTIPACLPTFTNLGKIPGQQTRGPLNSLSLGVLTSPFPQAHVVSPTQIPYRYRPRRLLPKPDPLSLPRSTSPPAQPRAPPSLPLEPDPDPDPDQPLDMTVQHPVACSSPSTPPPSADLEGQILGPPIVGWNSPSGGSSLRRESSSPDSEVEAALPSGLQTNIAQDPSKLLWEFIDHLLVKAPCPDVVRWEDADQLMFRIVSPGRLAALWGLQKHKAGMTYEKLSRALRYYYKMNIISKVMGKRLTYRFLRHPSQIQRGQRGAKRGVPHRPRGMRLQNYHSTARTATQPNPCNNSSEEKASPEKNIVSVQNTRLSGCMDAMTSETISEKEEQDDDTTTPKISSLALSTPILVSQLVTHKATELKVAPLVDLQRAPATEHQHTRLVAPLYKHNFCDKHQHSHLVAPRYRRNFSDKEYQSISFPVKVKTPTLDFLAKNNHNNNAVEKKGMDSRVENGFLNLKMDQVNTINLFSIRAGGNGSEVLDMSVDISSPHHHNTISQMTTNDRVQQ